MALISDVTASSNGDSDAHTRKYHSDRVYFTHFRHTHAHHHIIIFVISTHDFDTHVIMIHDHPVI